MPPSDNDGEADDGKPGLADEMQKLREKWERLWALKDSHEYQLACHAAVQANKLEFALNDGKSGGSSENGEDGDSEESDSESSDSEDSDSEDDVGDGHSTFDQCTVSATVCPDGDMPRDCIATLRMTAIAECRVNIGTFRDDILDTIPDAEPLAYSLLNRHGMFRSELWGPSLVKTFVYIEEIDVKHSFRGMGIGTKIFTQVLNWVGKKARELRGEALFVGSHLVVSPGLLRRDLVREFGEGNLYTGHYGERQAEVDAFGRNLADKSVAFWRKQGFRRVGLSGFWGYATNHEDPSRQLTAEEDAKRDDIDSPELDEMYLLD